MNTQDFCNNLWEYYLVLENDFLQIERYVSFDLGENFLYDKPKDGTVTDEKKDESKEKIYKNCKNSLTYSYEFIKQYQAICSEADVIMKAICKEIDEDSKANNISVYKDVILKQKPSIIEQKVRMKDIELQPFINWGVKRSKKDPCKEKIEDEDTIDWWDPYNLVKHRRMQYFECANLKNVINALAALYIFERILLKMIADREGTVDVPFVDSKLFTLINFETDYISTGTDVVFKKDKKKE